MGKVVSKSVKFVRHFWIGKSCFIENEDIDDKGLKVITVKKVGELRDNDTVYFTPRNVTRNRPHFYGRGNGYPIDVPILDDLIKFGVEIITILTYTIDEETDRKIPVEQRDFSVAEYNSAQEFKHHNFGRQKCVDWDRQLPQAESKKSLYSLDEFYKEKSEK